MVRINLVFPDKLSDQHLIAEYNEIFWLMPKLRKWQRNGTKIPKQLNFGKGYQKFWTNKTRYLAIRHVLIRFEMEQRGFKATKKIGSKALQRIGFDYAPSKEDLEKTKQRILDKLLKRPNWYRYHGEKKDIEFWKELMK